MTRSAGMVVRRLTAMLAVLACCGIAAAGPASAVGGTDWPAFLGGPAHASFSSDAAITPANATALVNKWHFSIGFVSSPVVADGSIFIGSFSGYFYKINAANGVPQDKIFLGFQPKLTCAKFGFASTATVAKDPSTGKDVVYVAAPDGYLYAFDEATMTQLWRSVIAIPSTTKNDYFNWSSPTVSHGKIYVGLSSNCDIPLIRGGVLGFDQHSGKRIASFYTVPKGVVGASVWSSVAVDGTGDVYVTTGNAAPGAKNPYYSDAMLKLSPALKLLSWFQVPKAAQVGDGDFGGSPTVFTATIKGAATSLVGACNKNGIYYALRRSTMTRVWQRRIGVKASGAVEAQCQSAAAFNGKFLYMAGPGTTINGKAYRGSVERISPATGAISWQTGLPNGVLTSPTINSGGIIAVGTYDNTTTPNSTYLINASTGANLTKLVDGIDFPQSVFANGWLFTANLTGMDAWGP